MFWSGVRVLRSSKSFWNLPVRFPFALSINSTPYWLAHAGEENITLKIRLQSQPWHLYSGLIVRYILAAACESKTAARQVMQAVADHREEFEFTDHCTGPNRDATPNQILERLKTYSGVDAMAAFDRPDLQNAIKWHCKYARQNGIHVSPTFMVNGLVQPEISSGDDIEQWASFLKR